MNGMTGNMTFVIGIAAILFTVVFVRLLLSIAVSEGEAVRMGQVSHRADLYAVCQTTGSQVVQADCVQVCRNFAGTMAAVADGIGKENTGKLCAQIAVDTILDRYEPYRELQNPQYFLRTSFYEANIRIQKTIGERRGGACLAAIFLDGASMYYALAGDIRIALLRGKELIPISEGHTMDVLAAHAYQDGRISRKEAVWSMDEKRIWNYLGMDGFHEMEIGEAPVRLKAGDLVFAATKGIWQELSWAEIEDVLLRPIALRAMAMELVRQAEGRPEDTKENGSVLIIKAEVSNAAD